MNETASELIAAKKAAEEKEYATLERLGWAPPRTVRVQLTARAQRNLRQIADRAAQKPEDYLADYLDRHFGKLEYDDGTAVAQVKRNSVTPKPQSENE